MIDFPDRLGEESVVVAEVTVGSRVARDDQVGDVAMSRGQDPSGHQQTKRLETWLGEDGRKGD